MKYQRVIYFDGVCGLCNGFVDFILKIDRKELFVFSPLQGELAKQTLSERDLKDLSSVVVFIDGEYYRKSEAVLRVFKELGFPWNALCLAGVLPTSITNLGYELVASQRYRIFGQTDTCRLPTADERSRFIN